ncbi:MAG: peptidoglycan-binding domain-containing protein [Usitatibacter sp.]
MKMKQIAIATAAALSMGAAFANDTTASSSTSYNSPDQSYTGASAGTMSTQDKDLVRQVQQTLQSKGYSPGPIDGQWGNRTQAALKKFQQSQGTQASGSLDSSTLVALGVSQGSGGTSTSTTGAIGANINSSTNPISSSGTSMPDTSTPMQAPGAGSSVPGSSSVNSTGSTSSTTGQGTSSSR